MFMQIKRFGSRLCEAGEGDCSRDSDCSGSLVSCSSSRWGALFFSFPPWWAFFLFSSLVGSFSLKFFFGSCSLNLISGGLFYCNLIFGSCSFFLNLPRSFCILNKFLFSFRKCALDLSYNDEFFEGLWKQQLFDRIFKVWWKLGAWWRLLYKVSKMLLDFWQRWQRLLLIILNFKF